MNAGGHPDNTTFEGENAEEHEGLIATSTIEVVDNRCGLRRLGDSAFS